MLVGSVVSIAAGLILGTVVGWRRRRPPTAVTGRPAPDTPGTEEETSGLLGREQVLRSFLASSATTREADYDEARTRYLLRAVIAAIVAVLATVTAVATVAVVTDQGEVVAIELPLDPP